ncbi:amidase signature domain-containing protein, partial [Microdochium bolleyi]
MLQSLEGVMQHVEQSPEYLHPSLIPQPVVGGSRIYHQPAAEDNPMNAWSHCCHLEAAHPTSDLLKGRTVAIKDNISVGGLPTTLGTHPELLHGKEFPVSTIDATVVARLLSAGAVVKGTSTCENFCASALSWTSASGPVHHPLRRGYTSGGSSSGSCALVAAHKLQRSRSPHTAVAAGDQSSYESLGPTVELAIGSDQAGSVRNPACYTGLYGLKPTFGLVPYTGAASMSPMIDHLGPIAASLEDVALLLRVMAGWDGIDAARMTPESPRVEAVVDYPAKLADFRRGLKVNGKPPGPPLRVGLLTESFLVPDLDPAVATLIRDNTRAYFTAAGATVVDVSVPMHTEAPLIWTAAARPSMSQFLSQGRPAGHLSYLPPHLRTQWPPAQKVYDLLNKSNPALVNIHLAGQLAAANTAELSAVAPAWLEAKAHRKVFELRAAYDAVLDAAAKDSGGGVDVLVLPCAPTPAMPHPDPAAPILERLRPAIGLTSNTCPFNVTGHPAMSVPCGTLPVAV